MTKKFILQLLGGPTIKANSPQLYNTLCNKRASKFLCDSFINVVRENFSRLEVEDLLYRRNSRDMPSCFKQKLKGMQVCDLFNGGTSETPINLTPDENGDTTLIEALAGQTEVLSIEEPDIDELVNQVDIELPDRTETVTAPTEAELDEASKALVDSLNEGEASEALEEALEAISEGDVFDEDSDDDNPPLENDVIAIAEITAEEMTDKPRTRLPSGTSVALKRLNTNIDAFTTNMGNISTGIIRSTVDMGSEVEQNRSMILRCCSKIDELSTLIINLIEDRTENSSSTLEKLEIAAKKLNSSYLRSVNIMVKQPDFIGAGANNFCPMPTGSVPGPLGYSSGKMF